MHYAPELGLNGQLPPSVRMPNESEEPSREGDEIYIVRDDLVNRVRSNIVFPCLLINQIISSAYLPFRTGDSTNHGHIQHSQDSACCCA